MIYMVFSISICENILIDTKKGVDLMSDLRQIIAHNIVRLRTARGWTQAELAERLSYSDKAISKWERGESLPDVIVLKQLADLFSLRVDDLLSEDTPMLCAKSEKIRKQNHMIITLLAVMLVWLIASLVFFIFTFLPYAPGKWLVFLFAIPTSAIVLIVFNSIWGNTKWNYPIISVLVWSLLLCIHFCVYYALSVHLWVVYGLGIPAQIIILLWSGLTASERKAKKAKKEGDD